MKNESLRKSIQRIGIIVGALMIVLLATLIIYMRVYIETNIEKNHQAMVSFISDQIESEIEVPLKLISRMDHLIDIGYAPSSQSIRDYMETVMLAHDYFDQIQIIDKEGTLINAIPYTKELMGNSMLYAPYFKNAVKDEIKWSEVFISTRTNRPAISATMDKGDYVIVVDFNLDNLPIELSTTSYFTEITDIAILDQWGTYVKASDTELVEQRVIHPLFDNDRIQENFRDGDKETIFNKVDSMDWYIVSTFDLGRVYKRLDELTVISFTLCLVFGLSIVLVMRRYFRRLRNDVGALQNKTHQIIESDYKMEAYEFTFNEFKELAWGFDVMNEEISFREKTINDVNIELKEHIKLAEEANGAKSHFLAVMSHEMRTPLNGMIGFLQMLSIETLNKNSRELVSIITHSSKILLALVNDLLDVSKYEANKASFEEVSIDFCDTVKKVLGPYNRTAQHKGIDFQFSIKGIEPLKVMADPIKITQLFTNIVSNAFKFTEKGYVSITCESEERDDAYHLEISVEDSGIGIKEGVKEVLFKPFAQGDDSISREFGGTGLGLVICKNIVSHYNGSIDFTSDYGTGTTFTFDLLLTKALPMIEEALELKDRENVKAHQKVLIAEDNEVNQKLLLTFLGHYGIECELAVNGNEAVEWTKQKEFDIIFMDCQMPQMDGIEATREIRLWNKHVKIYAMTAYTSKEDHKKCMDIGMDGFYTKPIDMGEIAKLLGFYEAYEQDHSVDGYREDSIKMKDSKEAYVAELERRIGFDRETCVDLIETYIRQAKDIFEEIDQLAMEKHYTEIGPKLHQLKGASGAVRLEKIRQSVAAAEKMIEEGQYEKGLKVINHISNEALFIE